MTNINLICNAYATGDFYHLLTENGKLSMSRPAWGGWIEMRIPFTPSPARLVPPAPRGGHSFTPASKPYTPIDTRPKRCYNTVRFRTKRRWGN